MTTRRVHFAPLPFRPTPWAPGPHAQTLLARALRPSRGPAYRRERIETADGDFVDLDWTVEPRPGAPVVLVLHGLEGSSARGYVRSACRALLARGLHPVAMNFRGCSGEPNRTTRAYHSGESGDALLALSVVRERAPESPVGALGFSLGGNVLLKLLGERADGGWGVVDAAVGVSVPYDLAAGSALLERPGMGPLYAGYFLRSLRAKLRAKARILDGRIDLAAAGRARTLRAFDDVVTAPLHGFRSAEEYYREASSARFIEGVRVPTLLLHSVDDPFLPASALPRAALARNAHLVAAVTRRGGHVGWVEGAPWRPRFWAEGEAARFLAGVLRA